MYFVAFEAKINASNDKSVRSLCNLLIVRCGTELPLQVRHSSLLRLRVHDYEHASGLSRRTSELDGD